MSSVLTVKISYTDNSKSLSEEFQCADTHPSPEVIKDCEQVMWGKWTEMGGSLRDTKLSTTIKRGRD